MFSIRASLTEAASTSAATHRSPAVQHWSLCVFWRTGPECDVISLLRQKRQARSPPSGHRPLSWTGALYATITEWLRQTSSVAYGNSKSSSKKLWSQELGRGHTSVEDAGKAWTGKTETSTALKTCHPQWTRTTMNSASSLSFSESWCAVDWCAVLTLEFSQIWLFTTNRMSALMVAIV